MEGEEGDVLKSHLDEDMDEEIDWYDPIRESRPRSLARVGVCRADLLPRRVALVIPPDAQQGGPTSDAANCETIRQAMSDAMDLDEELESPVEPADPYTQPSADPTPMSLSPELRDDDSVQSSIAHAQASTTPLGGWAANDEIQNLLGQITAGSLGAPQQQQQQHYNPYTSSYSQHPPPQQPPALDQSALSALAGFDTQLVRGIIQQNPQLASLGPQLDQLGVFGAPPPTTNGGNGDVSRPATG